MCLVTRCVLMLTREAAQWLSTRSSNIRPMRILVWLPQLVEAFILGVASTKQHTWLHLWVPHRLSPWQLHLIKDRISSDASSTPAGSVTGTGDFDGTFLVYPYSTRSVVEESMVCNCALFTFFVKASMEGGSEWILGAEIAVFPNLVAQILFLISDIVVTVPTLP